MKTPVLALAEKESTQLPPEVAPNGCLVGSFDPEDPGEGLVLREIDGVRGLTEGPLGRNTTRSVGSAKSASGSPRRSPLAASLDPCSLSCRSGSDAGPPSKRSCDENPRSPSPTRSSADASCGRSRRFWPNGESGSPAKRGRRVWSYVSYSAAGWCSRRATRRRVRGTPSRGPAPWPGSSPVSPVHKTWCPRRDSNPCFQIENLGS